MLSSEVPEDLEEAELEHALVWGGRGTGFGTTAVSTVGSGTGVRSGTVMVSSVQFFICDCELTGCSHKAHEDGIVVVVSSSAAMSATAITFVQVLILVQDVATGIRMTMRVVCCYSNKKK